MAEEEKPKQLVQMSTVIASGITAIIAALFTSRLGVAGTLIGTALTPMLMTIGVAILNAQIEKATNKISDLPSTVRGRISTQRVRVPETPTTTSPEERPEEPERPVAPRRRDMRAPGMFERLLSIPTYLREMSPSTRRRTLLTGVLAGLVAAVIGLVGVTGIEAVAGQSLSCIGRECSTQTASGGSTAPAPTSIGRVFGSAPAPQTQDDVPTGSEQGPADGLQQEAEPAPGVQQSPQDQQYQGTPQGGDQQSGEAPGQSPAEPVQQGEEQPAAGQEPGAVSQDGAQEPSADPGAEQQPAIPPEQQPATVPSGQQQ